MNSTGLCRVAFFTLYPETMPSSRLRVYQYLPHLEQHGIKADVYPAVPEPCFSRCYYSSSKWKRLLYHTREVTENIKRIGKSKNYDLVLIQKGLLLTNLQFLNRKLGQMSTRLVFDLDDLVYERSPITFSNPLLRRMQDLKQSEKISVQSRVIIAGNHYLKERALQYNRNVVVIPTPVDTERFKPQNKTSETRDKIVLGWIGTIDGLNYVRLLAPVFQQLSRLYSIELKLITRLPEVPFEIPGVKVSMVPWSYQTEIQEMAEFDIGLMPMPKDRWTLGKCSLKLLQYMAMEIPSVATRWGSNKEVVEEGVDGLLADEPEEWFEKISLLIQDAALRKKTGAAARQKILSHYSLRKTAPLFAQTLKQAAQS